MKIYKFLLKFIGYSAESIKRVVASHSLTALFRGNICPESHDTNSCTQTANKTNLLQILHEKQAKNTAIRLSVKNETKLKKNFLFRYIIRFLCASFLQARLSLWEISTKKNVYKKIKGAYILSQPCQIL